MNPPQMDANEKLADTSRCLSDEEKQRLASQTDMSAFQRSKLERDAKKNWDLFYKRNGDRFFKHRYWTRQEFAELFDSRPIGLTNNKAATGRYLLEVGCGCGDFIMPLLNSEIYTPTVSSCIETTMQREEEEEELRMDTHDSSLPNDLVIYCCDISDKAIDILKSSDVYKRNHPNRISAFPANIITDLEKIQTNLNGNRMDFISLVFVLSALEPSNMPMAIDNLVSLLKPGGIVLFRDYAIYDKAMLRFNEKSKICDQFYMRQDGTRAYFFTKEQLLDLFSNHSNPGLFECLSIDYVHRETINNSSGQKHSRIFLQAKFRKRPE